MTDPPSFLTLDEAIELTTAIVDRVARDHGVRCLFLKGPTLTAQGLRARHRSIDVDVLVSPADRPVIQEQLRRLGWRASPEPTGGLVLPLHSATLSHPMWQNEIDLHDRFPGFLADPATVFEILWQRRTAARIAGVDVACPDVVSHGLLAALHWLRDGDGHHAARLEYLFEELAERLDSSGRSDLAALAVSTGAAETARPLLDALAITPVPETLHDTTPWRIRTASTDVKGVGWVEELRRTSPRHVPRRIWRALVRTEAEIRHAQPDAEPGSWGLFKARVRRLRYGLHDLPRAVRIVWRESRG